MTGIDISQFKYHVVKPSLDYIGLGGDVAVNLLTGTAIAESRVTYLLQTGGGPALGFWQMEPFTHRDLYDRFLKLSEHASLSLRIDSMLCGDTERDYQLITNLRYACAMARVKYFSVSSPLPENTPSALSQYHKTYFNTSDGRANALSNSVFFQKAIDA